jgi:hypothetical protein
MAAYAYEFRDTSIISDAEYDKLSLEVDLSVDTRRPDLDKFWRENFSPSTGQWIHKHPELDRLSQLYDLFHNKSLTPGGAPLTRGLPSPTTRGP